MFPRRSVRLKLSKTIDWIRYPSADGVTGIMIPVVSVFLAPVWIIYIIMSSPTVR